MPQLLIRFYPRAATKRIVSTYYKLPAGLHVRHLRGEGLVLLCEELLQLSLDLLLQCGRRTLISQHSIWTNYIITLSAQAYYCVNRSPARSSKHTVQHNTSLTLSCASCSAVRVTAACFFFSAAWASAMLWSSTAISSPAARAA